MLMEIFVAKKLPKVIRSVNPKVIRSVNPAMIATRVNLALGAKEAFDILVNSHYEYKKVAEEEKTKRVSIEAWRAVNVGKIQHQTEILKSYLENTFSERRYAIDEMFDRLDVAMQTGNMDLMSAAMGGIVSIVKSSPLQEVEKLMMDLQDDNVEYIDF